jgi:isopentenyl-diphosphate delta-isomerase
MSAHLPETTTVDEELVVLVDEHDTPVGTAAKLQAHIDGVLHRAFSIFVFGHDGRLLIQRRALHKYHSGGLWANTCCGHPRPGEDVSAAALRRLREELALSCSLAELFTTSYAVTLSNGLVEHELNHVFVGRAEAEPVPNPEEVMELAWVEPPRLLAEMDALPDAYAEWLKITLPETLARFDHSSLT